MRLKTIILRQFRSHRDLTLDVEPGVNLFFGSNGAGKTNLLEAIAVLATGVSPRGGDSESMIQWGETGFAVKGVFEFDASDADPLTLEMKVRSGLPRLIRENEKIPVRLRDLLGRVPLVSFVPEDLAMVKGDPDQRRQAMDMILVQSDASYGSELRRYGEILRSRNAALRQISDGQSPADTLNAWDESLIEAGLLVCAKRAAFLNDFSPRVGRVYDRVSVGQEVVELIYKPSIAGPWDSTTKEKWSADLKAVREREIAVGSTLHGPQRDDILFQMDGRAAKYFASEGQKRTCAVSFKLAEIPYVHEKLGQKPICLLDDVLSELDTKRAEHLLDELSRTGQCFVTLTGLEAWPRHRPLPASIFKVNQEGIKRESSMMPSISDFVLAN